MSQSLSFVATRSFLLPRSVLSIVAVVACIGTASAQNTSPSASQAGAPAAAPPQTKQLPGVTVEGKKNPLEESDRKLHELIEKSAPCVGCDAKKPEVEPGLTDKIVDTAVGAFTPQASKPLDHDANTEREVDRAVSDRTRPSNTRP